MADGPAFYVYRDRASEFRWRLVSRNNRTVADSAEGYRTHASCLEALERVRQMISDPALHLHDEPVSRHPTQRRWLAGDKTLRPESKDRRSDAMNAVFEGCG